jgi:hypothetical protein
MLSAHQRCPSLTTCTNNRPTCALRIPDLLSYSTLLLPLAYSFDIHYSLSNLSSLPHNIHHSLAKPDGLHPAMPRPASANERTGSLRSICLSNIPMLIKVLTVSSHLIPRRNGQLETIQDNVTACLHLRSFRYEFVNWKAE